MKKITTLKQLKKAEEEKRAVIVNKYGKSRMPAAFIISMQGREIYYLFKSGMFLYEKKKKKVVGNNPKSTAQEGTK